MDLAHSGVEFPPPLDEARAFLGPVLAGSPAAVLLVTRAGRVVFANHGPNGEPADEVTGAHIEAVVSPANVERVREALSDDAQSFDIGETGPAGPVRWWKVDANPVDPATTLLIFSDITAQKSEEARLRRAESILVDTQGVAHFGSWEWEVSEPRAIWSEELYRIYGLEPGDYTPTYEGYLDMVHPDDRERVRAATDACFTEQKPYSHDERIYRGDGELRWLHTWAVPILDAKGDLVRLLGVCQDITDEKRAEGAMRAQMMTRALARRLLHDIIKRAGVPEHAVREIGRAVALERADAGESTPEGFAGAFTDMGFGQLRFAANEGGRFSFSATDLLERQPSSTLPSCFLTLGYLEGVVTALEGRPALGSEMRCQSMGHDACHFVVMTHHRA